MIESFINSPIFAFFNIIFINIVMSGDNAIIVGMAAASLPAELRKKAILYGILLAIALRIVFTVVAIQLLAIIGLTFFGGLLLAWVCWRMWCDLRSGSMAEVDLDTTVAAKVVDEAVAHASADKPVPTLQRALINIVVADLSMSLDNVLAVAGAARGHFFVLVFGLTLSIALMAVAATFIAKLLVRYHWIAYLGLAIIVYVAGDMLYRGGEEIYAAFLAG